MKDSKYTILKKALIRRLRQAPRELHPCMVLMQPYPVPATLLTLGLWRQTCQCLLWNADSSRSVFLPPFGHRVSAQRLPTYRMYLICPILRRRSLAPLSLSRYIRGCCGLIRNGKGVKTFRYQCSYSALNVRIALISLACSLWRISSSTPK